MLKLSNKLNFKTQNEIKLTSIGMEDLSPSAFKLISFLNSDIFLIYLQKLTGIKEKLFSDPYLLGGGYHEIKKGGFLDVHADFNKYKDVNLDRRINLLLYLNHDWNVEWNGNKVYAIEEIPVYNGKKGGKFYYNKSGNKVYI